MQFLDSFCGAGGLGLGLIEAGLEPVLSFDIDHKCVDTLKHNQKLFDHDIKQIDITEFSGKKFLDDYELQRGELFLIAGGPPCQGFSVQRIGDDHDPRNRLVYEYFRIVNEIYPKYFIMENVEGILGKRGKDVTEGIKYLSNEYGYDVSIIKVAAEDYGVPQRRHRVIFVGERRDIGKANFAMISPTTPVRKTVRETIEWLPAPPDDYSEHPHILNHRRDKLSKLNLKRIRAIGEGEGRDSLPTELLANCHKRTSSQIGHRNVYGRMKWDDIAPTITARFDSFTRGQFGHPQQDRTISLREGALLQTFPKEYIFVGNKVEVARQIGNAVPVKLGKAIGQSILESFSKKCE